MKIGNLEIPRTAALAPMAGVADRAFREICKEQGAAYLVGEMASSKGMMHRSRKTASLLEVTDNQRPLAVQIFGDEPATMADAAVMTLGFAPDAVDINMGCPAPKVAGTGSGCALMRDLPKAAAIVRAVSGAVAVPVTVKIRKGWDAQSVNAVEAAQRFEQNGAAAITLHGRTRAQMYAPPVDLEIIARVKRSVSIPVIGNGGITCVDDAVRMYETTGCDLVMVGQGALGKPWLFRQLDAYFRRGERLPDPEPEERVAIMLEHIRRACAYKGESVGMREARKHVAWYCKGWRGAAALRRKAGSLSRFEEMEAFAREALDAMRAGFDGD